MDNRFTPHLIGLQEEVERKCNSTTRRTTPPFPPHGSDANLRWRDAEQDCPGRHFSFELIAMNRSSQGPFSGDLMPSGARSQCLVLHNISPDSATCTADETTIIGTPYRIYPTWMKGSPMTVRKSTMPV